MQTYIQNPRQIIQKYNMYTKIRMNNDDWNLTKIPDFVCCFFSFSFLSKKTLYFIIIIIIIIGKELKNNNNVINRY